MLTRTYWECKSAPSSIYSNDSFLKNLLKPAKVQLRPLIRCLGLKNDTKGALRRRVTQHFGGEARSTHRSVRPP
jgi:hypothetical protein